MANNNSKRKLAILIPAIPSVVVGVLCILIGFLGSADVLHGFTTMILQIVVIAICSLGMIFGTKKLLNGFRHATEHLDQVAEGNMPVAESAFTQRNDEIGEMVRSLMEMVQKFATVISAIRNATETLDDVSDSFKDNFSSMEEAMIHVTEEIENITGNTEEQHMQTTEMAEKVIEVSEALERIAEKISELAQSATKMKEYNTSSQSIMRELVSISDESEDAIRQVSEQTELTNQSAIEIQEATDIIQGIASQTNLLALNASIEAARAGEQGKGFAVVADEIRVLADQSRASSEQIRNVVENLIKNSNVSVETTHKVAEAFENQNQKIQETEGIFEQLNSEIDLVNDSISDIDTDTARLERHMGRITTGVELLTKVAQENTDSIAQTAAASEEVTAMVTTCKESTEEISHVTIELVDNVEKVGDFAAGFRKTAEQ